VLQDAARSGPSAAAPAAAAAAAALSGHCSHMLAQRASSNADGGCCNQHQRLCVELFARELFPGWLSWSNECIKFQDMTYWRPVQSEAPA
jgi:hypothetical protein